MFSLGLRLMVDSLLSMRLSWKGQTGSSRVRRGRWLCYTVHTLTLPLDIHITSDGVIVMFHDPTLERTTTGKGKIREQPWRGVIE